jgi:hypothetical protein
MTVKFDFSQNERAGWNSDFQVPINCLAAHFLMEH